MRPEIWDRAVNDILRKDRRPYKVWDINASDRAAAYEANQSPVLFAKTIPHRKNVIQSKPEPVPQTETVKADPKYQLDTGIGIRCPTCGSTFIKAISKPGTGMGYIGSASWIATTSIIETVVKSMQKQPYLCGYCDSMFTELNEADLDEFLPTEASW